MSDRARWVLAIAILPLGALASYGLALAGEPQSLWLWRDVLGLIN